MGAVTLALVAFFVFVIVRVSQPAMGVLYADLSLQDASTIIRDLEAKGVSYEARATVRPFSRLAPISPASGWTSPPRDCPRGAASATKFSTRATPSRRRALSRTSTTCARSRARSPAPSAPSGGSRRLASTSHPERRLFDRDREPPRASVVLRLRGELDAGQVRAVLPPRRDGRGRAEAENISIVDEQGRLLADGARGDGSPGSLIGDEKQSGIERRLRGQVEEIVAGVVGSGRARVQIAAELDLNRVESRSETYDPESRVMRSNSDARREPGDDRQRRRRQRRQRIARREPAGPPRPRRAIPRTRARKPSTTRFRARRGRKSLESGRIKRLSVAVLVDGIYSRSTAGEVTYQPRSQEDLDRIAALVRTPSASTRIAATRSKW